VRHQISRATVKFFVTVKTHHSHKSTIVFSRIIYNCTKRGRCFITYFWQGARTVTMRKFLSHVLQFAQSVNEDVSKISFSNQSALILTVWKNSFANLQLVQKLIGFRSFFFNVVASDMSHLEMLICRMGDLPNLLCQAPLNT